MPVYSKSGVVCMLCVIATEGIMCPAFEKTDTVCSSACQGCAAMALSFSSVRAFLLDIAVSAVAE